MDVRDEKSDYKGDCPHQGLLRDMHSSSNVKLMEIGEGSAAERWGLVCQKYNEII